MNAGTRNDSAVMRTRQAAPAAIPNAEARPTVGCRMRRSISHEVSTTALVNASSRHPSVPDEMTADSIAHRPAAASPTQYEHASAPRANVSRIASTENAAEAKLTAESLSWSSHSQILVAN